MKQNVTCNMEGSTNGPKTSRRRVGVVCRKRSRRSGEEGVEASEGGAGASRGRYTAVVRQVRETLERICAGTCESQLHASECRVPMGHEGIQTVRTDSMSVESHRSKRSAMDSRECAESEEWRTKIMNVRESVEKSGNSSKSRLSASDFDDMRAEPVLSAVLSRWESSGSSGGRCKSSVGGWPRRRTRQSALQSVSEAFLIGVCFFSLLRLPTLTFAVPLGRGLPSVSMAEDRFNTRPKWINVCGDHVDNPDGRQSIDGRHSPGNGSPVTDPGGEHLTDEQLISSILIEAKDALKHAEMWRRDYVNQTFNVDFETHHEAWKTNRYSWLPTLEDIPKELEERTPESHLEKLSFVDTLKSTFTFMQKYACGLEQVTWDLEDKHSAFSTNFKDAELQLRDIICEIEVALIEKGEKVPANVERSIMPKEYRSMGHVTHRNLRDWLIFRDYMNGVEYVIQVFEFLKTSLEDKKA